MREVKLFERCERQEKCCVFELICGEGISIRLLESLLRGLAKKFQN